MINVKLEQNMDEILNIKDLIGYLSLRMNDVPDNYPLNFNFVWNNNEVELFVDQKEQTIAVNAKKILFAAENQKETDDYLRKDKDFSLYDYFKTGFSTTLFRGVELLRRFMAQTPLDLDNPDYDTYDYEPFFEGIYYNPDLFNENMPYGIKKTDLDSFFKNAGPELNKLLEEKYENEFVHDKSNQEEMEEERS